VAQITVVGLGWAGIMQKSMQKAQGDYAKGCAILVQWNLNYGWQT
jgi:hypothetical protein